VSTNSAIEWCDHTFNPWRGCTKVSEGCRNCYAEALSHRNPSVLGQWGPPGTRVPAAESYWRQPVKWDREAKVAGVRRRVFCASLADVFEGPETMPPASIYPIRAARRRLFDIIRQTPNLDWLLLTKRPAYIMERVERAAYDGRPSATTNMLDAWLAGHPPENIWIGTSVENQETADERIPHLLKTPATIRFLSCEPLLGPIDLARSLALANYTKLIRSEELPALHWLIDGGESGPGARRYDFAWSESIERQCEAAGVAYFRKQIGSNAGWTDADGDWHRWPTKDPKGGTPEQWPDRLSRVRQFPNATEVSHA
jgi:protein gp37